MSNSKVSNLRLRYSSFVLLVLALAAAALVFGRSVSLRQERDESAEETGENVKAREEWFYFQRAYPFGTIPPDARRRAWGSRPTRGKSTPEDPSLAGQTWQSIGPVGTISDRFPSSWGLVSGRVNAIAIAPNNPQLILIGGAVGGIWRSTDGGAQFTSVSDNLPDVAVSSITFSPSNPQIVYAGMSDTPAFLYLGHGVMKSTDGGQTWAQVNNGTLPGSSAISRIVVDPGNSNRVFVAMFAFHNPAFPNCCETGGLYLSTDGGVNWNSRFRGTASDLVVHPTNAQILYAAFRSIVLNNQFFGTAGIARSTDGGDTWSIVYSSAVNTDFDCFVAISPVNPQRVYAYSGDSNSVRLGVSGDGGSTWNAHTLTDVDKGQFGFNSYLVTDPVDGNIVYIGSRDIFKSSDGGTTFANLTNNFGPPPSFSNFTPTTSSTHPDQHALVLSLNPSVMYSGNDGGLFKSTDGGNSFQSLNSTLSLTQFHGYALDPTDATRSYGGTQDNGLQQRTAPSSQWLTLFGGDGGHCVVNPANPSIIFTTLSPKASNRVFQRWSNFGLTLDISLTLGSFGNDARVTFTAPFTGNGVDTTLYYGTHRLWVSTDLGSNWSPPGGTTDLTKGITSAGGDSLNAIGVARSVLSTAQVIYTGSLQGRAMVSTNGGQTWTDITAGLPNRSITSITVEPSNPAIAYITLSGFRTGHVFRTINTGANWTDISGNLPDIPSNDLLIDPLNSNTLYAGTDIGIFRSTTGGSSWIVFNDGMPPVVVKQFDSQTNGLIHAATYGRGAYVLPLTAAASTIQFTAAAHNVTESAGSLLVNVTRSGDTANAATVEYNTSDTAAMNNCNVINGIASSRCDYISSIGTLRFANGETSKSILILFVDDAYAEGSETFTISLNNPTGASLGTLNTATVTISDNETVTGSNPIDQASFFAREHYMDFLNREPDAAGLAFWINEITQCGSDQACIELKRINVSAAFFLSIEFQETGYLAYRMYKAAYGDTTSPNVAIPVPIIRLQEFLPDAGAIGQGVQVGVGNWQAQLEANKNAFAREFVLRPRFLGAYPLTMTATQFVNKLDLNAGGVLSQAERNQLIAELTAAPDVTAGRASVTRKVAEDADLRQRETNRAFVLMQYYGYLRRNPNDAPDTDFRGWEFWLNKLNQFNGNFINAEMVKAFIVSIEYRQRFGQ